MSCSTYKNREIKILYHYKLNFKKEVCFQNPKPDDIGFIIASSLGNRCLYGVVYFTNARFADARAAKEYLCLTYSPLFRYIPEIPHNMHPVHICDREHKILVSQRTCPAFGDHGGVGEWIIPFTKKANRTVIPLEVDKYYSEGGETKRWYMAAWDRELLSALLSAYTARNITSDTLEKTLKGVVTIEESEELKEPGSFWFEDSSSVLISKPSGIVAYSPLSATKVENYQLLAYLSVSCGYQMKDDGTYIKLWGALWEDYLKLPDSRTYQNTYCDEDFLQIKTELKKEDYRDCIHHDLLKNFEEIIDSNDICGVRFCSYLYEIGDIFFPNILKDENNRQKFILSVSRLVVNLKDILKVSYKKPSLTWCNVPKTIVLLPKIGVPVTT